MLICQKFRVYPLKLEILFVQLHYHQLNSIHHYNYNYNGDLCKLYRYSLKINILLIQTGEFSNLNLLPLDLYLLSVDYKINNLKIKLKINS